MQVYAESQDAQVAYSPRGRVSLHSGNHKQHADPRIWIASYTLWTFQFGLLGPWRPL